MENPLHRRQSVVLQSRLLHLVSSKDLLAKLEKCFDKNRRTNYRNAVSNQYIIKFPLFIFPVACPSGSVNINNTCVHCPRGSYQDESGQTSCKPCPDGTYTLDEGSQSIGSCLTTCGYGMHSSTGLIPCQLCPRHTFSGPAPVGGFKECEACPSGAYTAKLGASSPTECRLACKPGSYSNSGLEPCSPCSINFYQPTAGQQSCIECSNSTATQGPGESTEASCFPIDCSAKMCENNAECSVFMHRAQCHCKPGYVGDRCETIEDVCATQPCYNGGKCEQIGATYKCSCPKNFNGARCQFESDECVGVTCPNGGVCHDLPGTRTTTCLCRWASEALACQAPIEYSIDSFYFCYSF